MKKKSLQGTQEKFNPFLVRALAKAALTVCFQFRKTPRIPVSLWATATGLPLTSTRWQHLERDAFIVWNNERWLLTTNGARVLRAGGIKFPARIVTTNFKPSVT